MSADYLGGKEVFHYSIPAVQATGDGQLEDGDEIDSSKLLVEQPQVLISKLNPRKNTVCLAGPREVVTVCSGEFVPLQSDCMDLKWVYYLVSSENFKKRLESLVESATRSHQRVNPSDILKFRGAFPLLAEQTQIARFLDHETTRIDALIEEQQRLIELLKEKRQAVISHAVTKGLDPTVPMKDSGVEWLGEVPAHWALVPFGLAFEYQEGPGIMAVDFRDEGVPLVRISGVQGRWVTLEGCNYLEPSKVKEKWAHFRLDKGDLIISGSASMGLVSEVGEDAAGAVAYTGLIRLKPRANVSIRDFIRSVVGSYQFHAQIDLLKAGSTIQHFGPTHLSQMKVVLPPVNEQAQIAAYVDTISVQFDELLGEAENTNALLQERRSALISAAVTGKIDVRGWQPPASTQAPESAVAEAN
ncbi:restriction endonuclease subunit S [Stutzerimonas balearica]|uniref:restriction endonuclease subunit S n=1 Tax=Stutzerimonas balearica TaxID=74829 RepID=UPI001F51FDBD|nr:restriction endonuclease subunit S [Stutzerimonas balearica]